VLSALKGMKGMTQQVDTKSSQKPGTDTTPQGRTFRECQATANFLNKLITVDDKNIKANFNSNVLRKRIYGVE